MMVKITQHCSMNCKHCMNDAKPNNKHMTFDMFQKVLRFHDTIGASIMLITGGEPTEHPQFKEFLIEALEQVPFIVITTNGMWMQDKYDYVEDVYKKYGKRVMWQVSCDPEFYPEHINQSLSVFQIESVQLFPEQRAIYPQGRALTNNLSWESKACKCFNIRAIAKQVSDKMPLSHVLLMMQVKGYNCTPHIAIDGSIRLGESDLCPPCSSIFRTHDEILLDIRNFSCHGCDHVNKNLASKFAAFVDVPGGAES